MSGFNSVTIIGRLGQDPELKYTANGAAVCSISVATSESWKDKQTGEKVEKTEWHRIVFFGNQAAMVGEYFTKGSNIHVEGKLQTDKWEKDGQTHYTTKIVGRLVTFLDKKGGGQQQSGQGGFRNTEAKQQPAKQADFADDDIPF